MAGRFVPRVRGVAGELTLEHRDTVATRAVAVKPSRRNAHVGFAIGAVLGTVGGAIGGRTVCLDTASRASQCWPMTLIGAGLGGVIGGGIGMAIGEQFDPPRSK